MSFSVGVYFTNGQEPDQTIYHRADDIKPLILRVTRGQVNMLSHTPWFEKGLPCLRLIIATSHLYLQTLVPDWHVKGSSPTILHHRTIIWIGGGDNLQLDRYWSFTIYFQMTPHKNFGRISSTKGSRRRRIYSQQIRLFNTNIKSKKGDVNSYHLLFPGDMQWLHPTPLIIN